VPPPGTEMVEVKRVEGPAGKKHGSQPRVFYLETIQPLTIQPGPGGEIIEKCPKKSRAINGYYYKKGLFTGFGLDDQGSSPSGFRRWAFYWDNESPTPIDGVTLGLVCDKDG
jgi:hypothetical protein